MKNKLVPALLISMGATIAAADTVNMNFVGTGAGRNVRISVGNTSMNVFAGQLRFNVSGGTGVAQTLTGERVTYCIDLHQGVSAASNSFNVVDPALLTTSRPMGSASARAIEDIFSASPLWSQRTSATQDYGAGLQLAIWDIVTDFDPQVGLASLGLTTGSFQATQTNGNAMGFSIRAHYDTFISMIGRASQERLTLLGLGSGSLQDQVVALQIPAPGVAGLAGLVMLSVARRRRAAQCVTGSAR